jgi:hypothetical protein
MTFALRTHPSSVLLWLLRLGIMGVASSDPAHIEDWEELGDLCRKALEQIPVKVTM